MSGSLHFDLDGKQGGKRARVCFVLPDRTLHVVGLMLSIGWNNVRWGRYRENLSNRLNTHILLLSILKTSFYK